MCGLQLAIFGSFFEGYACKKIICIFTHMFLKVYKKKDEF